MSGAGTATKSAAAAPDTGLAVERTALAWRRTAISAMASAALFGKVAAEGGVGWQPTGLLPLASAVVMVVLAVVAVARNRSLRRREHRAAVPLLPFVAGGVAAVGLVSIGMVLAHAA
ncbi:DUF202 domain-containing protein [Nocardia concava]|uniref:DUF202 domain-containing protein n=1 Tax=Nocardia concava TaxID=257281 RepID=UPI0002F13F56|nr:DUF202 domain-containing protein [Nocardia concava]